MTKFRDWVRLCGVQALKQKHHSNLLQPQPQEAQPLKKQLGMLCCFGMIHTRMVS